MTMKIQPEFSRPVPVEEIGKGMKRRIEATAEELRALEGRMKLPAIRALSAELSLSPAGKGGYRVSGEMRATVDQECVRTLEVFTSELAAPVDRLFVPADSRLARALEQGPVMELAEEADEAPDIIEDDTIDLGELVAETLALSLDPWPRKPGTDFVDYSTEEGGKAPAREPEKPNPFAVLSRLRKD